MSLASRRERDCKCGERLSGRDGRKRYCSAECKASGKREQRRLSPHRVRMKIERRSRPRKRTVSTLMHYIAQVGDEMGMAYGLLDFREWPKNQLSPRALRSLEIFDRFLTPATERMGIKVRGGVLLVRADGTVEERADLRPEMIVLA